MSKAAELAALIGSQTALSNRNLIINGAMQVNQRGNKTNTSGSSVYFVDRWNLFENTGALAANLQQSTVVPSGQGFGNSLLIDCTTADSSVAASHVSVLRQIIEGQNLQSLAYGTSDAKSLTVSFWVRSTKTGTYALEIYHNATQARHQVHPYTISSADTWEYKSITFSGDTSATIDNDNQATFYVQWALSAGSDYTSGTQQTTWANFTDANRFAGQVNFFDSTSNNFYLTGVQLEVGEQATPFEHKDFATTLDKCQRYYQVVGDYRGIYTGSRWSSTQIYATYPLACPLRASPALSTGGAFPVLNKYDAAQSASATALVASAAEAPDAFNTAIVLIYTLTGYTPVANNVYQVSHNGATTFVVVDSEL
jgi:hypothetical protein